MCFDLVTMNVGSINNQVYNECWFIGYNECWFNNGYIINVDLINSYKECLFNNGYIMDVDLIITNISYNECSFNNGYNECWFP